MISFEEQLSYIGNDLKWPHIEGAEVRRAKHIVDIHLLERSIKNTVKHKIGAYCLQSSDLQGKLLNIQVELEDYKIIQCACTCKANSARCKHIAAVLQLLERMDEGDLSFSSCTDQPQKWGKNLSKNMYEPIPMSEMCHVPKMECKEQQHFSEDEEELLNAFPNSAWALHKQGRRVVRENEESEDVFASSLHGEVLSLISIHNPRMMSSDEILEKLKCDSVEGQFYLAHIHSDLAKSEQIYKNTMKQRSNPWKAERQLRITGSICYELFTYSKKTRTNEEWQKKLERIIFSNFTGNKHTRYGIEGEKKAVDILHRDLPNSTIENSCGLLINHNYPYLGYSPDGFLKDENNELYLIEIKCLQEGKKYHGNEFAAKVSILREEEGKVILKKNHKYYGQIQLGLMLSNLSNAYLVLYCQSNETNYLVKVPFDEEFALKLQKSLFQVYFEIFLPFLITHKNRLFLNN